MAKSTVSPPRQTRTASLPLRKTETRRSGSRSIYELTEGTPDLPARFQVIRQLGSGGMGRVYRAYDRELGHEVAIKLLHSLAPTDRLKLKSEFRALANIIHPNLVNLYELFSDEKNCFFSMEALVGVELVEYVERTPRDAAGSAAFYARLRDVACQLALALYALHEGGKLHRDVKPSNVIVTDSGRAVLLDFGLIVSTQPSADSMAIQHIAGTVLYSAPEQLWGGALTPATDWYAFGATLFEALTGQLPIDGIPFEVANRKREFVVPSLRAHAPDIPAELDSLVCQLLHPTPSQRPSASQIIRALGGELPQQRGSVRPGTSQKAPLLIGRDTELARLHAAYQRAQSGSTTIVHVEGTSGIGKSTLIRHFLSEVEGSETLALTSRCHPQEALAFNAVDGLIDGLTHALQRNPELIVPMSTDQTAALLRLFPILARALVPDPDDYPAPQAEGQDVRIRAFAALRELLEHVARARTLVLWIDDLQWGDRDSGTLLRELLRGSGVALLLLLSYRAEDRDNSAALNTLATGEAALAPNDCEAISIGPLDSERSLEVVRSFLEAPFAGREDALAALVGESRGSPFFLRELALFLADNGAGVVTGGVALDEMLRRRTEGLPPGTRRLLDVFAVAGAPIEQRVALFAAGLGDQDRALVTNLERLSILRTTDITGRTLEVYHDRIRDQVLRQLDREQRTDTHRSIANALLTTVNPNPLVAVEHFEAAQDLESTRRYITAAANYASNALAFDRAARLYERAIALDVRDMAPHELRARLGMALSSGGRGREAGLAFASAADVLGSQDEGPLEQVLHLRQKAAEHLIQSGHYAQGLEVLHAVMTDLEIPFPRSRNEALRKATWLRLVSVFRGVRLPPQLDSSSDGLALLRFDTLWSAGIRLAMVDYTLSSYATVRCAIDGLRMAEPSRMICALALEATNSATLPFRAFQKRTDHLFALAENVSARAGSDYDRAFLLAARGVAACFRSDFRGSLSYMDQAIALLKQSARGTRWEFGLWQTWAMIGLAHLGEIKELAARADAVRVLAEQHDDRFTVQMIDLGRPTLIGLAQDRVGATIERANQALAWAPGDYNTQHYWHFLSLIEAYLYQGEFDAAWQLTVDAWPAHKKNHFLSVAFARDELLLARARAALGKASALKARGGATRELEMLRQVGLAAARKLQRNGLDSGKGWAELLRGVAHYLVDEIAPARAAFTRALGIFEAREMKTFRETARFWLGSLAGSTAGADAVEQAMSWMREQGVEKPLSMMRMLAGVIPDEPKQLSPG